MASKAEQVLDAILALFQGAATGASVERNADTPARISSAGTVVIRDGDPGEPEMTFSPRSYTYAHAARIEIAVIGATAADRAARLDALLVAYGAAIQSDPTLGGLCEWLEPDAPERGDMTLDGGETARWADFNLIAVYTTTSPLL